MPGLPRSVSRLGGATAAAALLALCASCAAPTGSPADAGTLAARPAPKSSPAVTPAAALHGPGLTLVESHPGSIQICVGPVVLTVPPQCARSVPATGIDLDSLPWRQTQSGVTWVPEIGITGSYQNGLFTITSARRELSPVSSLETPAALCANPVGDTDARLPANLDLASLLAGDPSYQGAWVTQGGGSADAPVFNVATVGDPSRMRTLVRRHYSGPLCVAAVPGPTRAETVAAQAKLEAAQADVGLVATSVTASAAGMHLHVQIIASTPDTEQRVQDIAGVPAAAIQITAIFA